MRLPQLLALLAAALPLAAQSPPERPAFEVASVKPHAGGGSSSTNVSPGRMNLENAPLGRLIRMAYAVMDFQISGAPEWVNSQGFDIVAKADGDFSGGRMLLALRALLEDRVQFKVHRETREGQVYNLAVAKGGPRLQRTAEGSCMVLDPVHFPRPAPGEKPVPMCDIRTAANGPNRTIIATGTKMSVPDMAGAAIAPFAFYLSQILNRAVIDKTEIAGMFDFRLEYTPDDADTSAPSGPSIFAALQEQLGLKLEAAKGPVELLVIDRVERPAAN